MLCSQIKKLKEKNQEPVTEEEMAAVARKVHKVLKNKLGDAIALSKAETITHPLTNRGNCYMLTEPNWTDCPGPNCATLNLPCFSANRKIHVFLLFLGWNFICSICYAFSMSAMWQIRILWGDLRHKTFQDWRMLSNILILRVWLCLCWWKSTVFNIFSKLATITPVSIVHGPQY